MTVLKMDELRGLYAAEYGVTKKEATEQLDGIFEFFEDVLVNQKKGFVFGDVGKFEVNLIDAKNHKRRNPQTGEEFMQHVPEHYAAKFKLSSGKTSVKAKLKE